MLDYIDFFGRPVMAIMVSNMAILRLRKQITHPRIRLMIDTGKKINITLYYFCIRQVQIAKRKITGYYWDEQSSAWLQREFPFPDILYLRSNPGRQDEPVFDELLDTIKNEGGHVINYPKFNKWRLYQILHEDPVMKSYLPETRAVEQQEDIEYMLRKHKTVYLKSQVGRKGRDVLRVEALGDERYRYSLFRKKKLTDKTVQGFHALIVTINKFFLDKSILVQEALKLPKYKNRLFDLRAEMQRNGNGTLEIAGISIRQGAPGSPISTHSSAYKFDDYLIEKMHYTTSRTEALLREVDNFLFKTYETIEKYCGKYVEIGIDFSIDVNKKLWFIEANSQSTKVSLEKSHNYDVLSRAYCNILEYASYLCKQSKGGWI